MANDQEYNIFQDDDSTELEKFGLSPDFIKSLSPTELKGLLSVIAKYAIRTRHPDRHTDSVDYKFGNVDARDLSSFAGHIALMSETDVEGFQKAYSEDSIITEYKKDIGRLDSLAERQATMLRLTQSSALELLSNRENEGETIKDFTGTIFCRYDDIKSLLLAFEVDSQGRASDGRIFKPASKMFVSDADQWVKDLAVMSQEYIAEKINSGDYDDTDIGAIPIVPTPNGIKVRFGDKLAYAHELGINNLPKLPRTKRTDKMFMITQSHNQITGGPGEQLFVEFTASPKNPSRVRLPRNNQILGFVNNSAAKIGLQSIGDEEINELLSSDHMIDPPRPRIRAKMSGRMHKTVNINEFWNNMGVSSSATDGLKFSLTPPSRYSPALYDKQNQKVTYLGDYYIAV